MFRRRESCIEDGPATEIVKGIAVRHPKTSSGLSIHLRRHQDSVIATSFMSTCSYLSGDPNQPRTAQPNFDS